MKFVHPIVSLVLLLCVSASPAFSQKPSAPPPIIDMHIHATGWDHFGNPPPPNPLSGRVPAARTDKEFMYATLAGLKRLFWD